MSEALEIVLYKHTDLLADAELEQLEGLVNQSILLVVAESGTVTESCRLAETDEVEVSLVNDEEIARVHGEFMDDPTATDVITFQHGEILVSVETAQASAAEVGHEWLRETLLYVIHGLLHLNGFDDLEESLRESMHRRQEEILAHVWPLPEEQ